MMDVIAHLPPDTFARLQVAVGQDHTVVATARWVDVVAEALRRRADAVVVDVAAQADGWIPGGPKGLDGIGALSELTSMAFPVLVYTPVTPATARHLELLIPLGVTRYVFQGIDDQPTRLRHRLEAVSDDGLENRILAPLLAHLSHHDFPIALSQVVTTLFRSPECFATAEQFALVVGHSRSWINRMLALADLPTSRTVVASAWALQVYRLSRRRNATQAKVAAQLRYNNVEVLSEQLKHFIGMSYREWRNQSPEQCVSWLRAKLNLRATVPFASDSHAPEQPRVSA
jgi:hypothetical protein